MSKTKIALLLPDLRGGGAERVSVDLAFEFAMAGHDVEFVLMRARGELLEEARASFPVVDLDSRRVRGVSFALARYLRRNRPNALLAALWPLTAIAPVATLVSGHRCMVLISEHGILSAQYRHWGALHRWLLRGSTGFGYRFADYRVGVSKGVVHDMAALSGMRKDAFDVIYNPVSSRPTPDSAALEKANSLWCGGSGARILTVGRMKAVKNHALLLRAFALLKSPDARLMFVGDGAEREAILSLAQKLGVAETVILAGFHPDPTPFYRTADVFVLSSDYEGFGNVIVEAMSCGTPVVSTDCPSGPREILRDGEFGPLVSVGDAEALSDAIDRTLQNPVASDHLRSRAADFHPANAAKAYLELLRG